MFKLTTPQQNIWNLQKYYEATSIGNICGAVFYDDKREPELLAKAVNKEIELQAGLRLRFREENGEPVQYISDYIPVEIPFISFDSQEEFDKFAEQYAKEPIGLIERQMHRFTVFEVEGRSGVIVTASHLVSDAWTFSIFAREVTYIYDMLSNGNALLSAPHSYEDYIKSEQKYFESERYKKDKTYWEEKYSEKPELCPIKYSAIPVSTPTSDRYSRKISKSVSNNIDKWCFENKISQAVFFEAAFSVYLSKINPENKSITIGIPVLNRTNSREKGTVGMFISTTPLTIAVSPEDTAVSLCKKLTTEHLALFRHQKYPYSHILKYVREKHDFTGNLYDVMISYQNAKTDTGAKTKWYSNGYSEVPFAFHIDNRDSADCYTMTIDYQNDIFKQPKEIELIAERILFVIDQIIENSNKTISTLNILPAAEYKKIIYEFNDTAVDYPKEKCVHELFTEQVQRTPDKIALVFEGKEFTYKQLDEMSNSLAHYLRNEIGIKPNDVVPIIAKRSWHIIVAMLGVLKAGAAYLPIDPAYPFDRIALMIETANPKILLTFDYSADLGYPLFSLNLFNYNENKFPITSNNNSSNICYVLFTSGSTGKPKAVLISHNNLTNFCQSNNVNNKYQTHMVNICETVLATTTFVFDISVFEIFLSLLNGLTIILTNELESESSEALAKLVRIHKIDALHCTPTKMVMYLKNDNFRESIKNIKIMMIGAEVFNEQLYENIARNTDAIIYNGYGPTETTIGCTFHRIINKSDINIGKPIANTQIYILDKDHKPLPIGVAGELCISGDGVGKGYLNRPDLTAEKFIPNPFIEGKTMYCTGDLARWRPDGEIEYLGRIDTQVKIRGLRIELGEIESVMSGFAGVSMVAVADKRDDTGRQYLVGYYTSETAIDESALRKLLSSKLPKYMVPNYFMRLDEMPMTASGKTDRKNLPIPEFNAVSDDYVAPETENEKALCGLLEEMMSIDKVGINDDFFGMGGDSLMAIEYVTKAHNLGIDFSLQSVFSAPTVRELCQVIENGASNYIIYSSDDFIKYEEILNRNKIDDSFIPEKHSLGNVLLTGATGFLGSHILDELMRSDTGKIYCLVRSNSPDDRRGRWREILNYYFGNKYDSEIGKRIFPVIGDITYEYLSKSIPDDIQTVIHTAATVKHYGAYEYFNRINVNGTKNVISFAKKANAKLIYISTISVSGNSLADEFSVYRSAEEKNFYEHSLYIGQPLDNVYVRSKFEAELAVLDSMLEGLDAKIIRVGNLTNRQSDSKFQPNYESNAFLTRFKAITELGIFPDYLMPLYAEFSPIDMTADGVVKIAQYAKQQCVFHLNSNKPIYFDKLLDVLKILGIKMEIVDGKTFNGTLQKIARDTNTEYIYEAFRNDMDEDGRLIYDSNIHIINVFTVDFLRKVGFEWKQTDLEYIRNYINYFRNIGYFKI